MTIGDNPWPGAAAGSAVDDARHQRWLDIVGADHWSVTVSGWIVLAINAQLLGSGLAAEAAQRSWLGEQIGRHRGREPVALITHKPVTAAGTELAAAPPYRFWPPPARDRLARLFAGTPPALVMSGHVHQYRLLRLDGTDHLWIPTTWAVLPITCSRCSEPSGAGSCHSHSPPGHCESRSSSSPMALSSSP
jgi:hypothetical protein